VGFGGSGGGNGHNNTREKGRKQRDVHRKMRTLCLVNRDFSFLFLSPPGPFIIVFSFFNSILCVSGDCPH